jgi:hypothetical protein
MASLLTNNTVYLVLYGHTPKNFTVVKLMTTLEKAYEYISYQEKHMYLDKNPDCKMLEINLQKDIDAHSSKNLELGICYIKKGYMKYDLEHECISSYIIVPREIE